ncbi:MAG: FAD-dependent oxidoreductase [Polaromonas sp.]|nr:MAG: FAD-dependent oxidoreductase [Polaromonas sp.]
MPGAIEPLGDGMPDGARSGSRCAGLPGMERGSVGQARQTLLAGCGLPAAWREHAQWRVLDISFGLGLNFLVTWAAWKADPLRPKLLHFVSTQAVPACAREVQRSVANHADIYPLALQLKAQLWGLLPGFHRLVFEGGRVLLTLCVGETKTMLRQQNFEADSVYLDGCGSSTHPGSCSTDGWDVHTLKAVALCCRRGTRMASWAIPRAAWSALNQCGFVVQKKHHAADEDDDFQWQYNPSWEPKKTAHPQRLPRPPASPRQPSTAMVIGAGLAGAAVANSLARRGWQVVVLDAATAPASGASGLPAGLLVPHVSLDDGLLSRLSRSGVRMTLQQSQDLLVQGVDWSHSGVLAHDVEGADTQGIAATPSMQPTGAATDWSCTATPAQLAAAGLAPASRALWHAPAGWIKPARLVHAWLNAPGIAWRGNARAKALQPCAQGWQALDESGAVLAQAHLVVIAAAYGSEALAASVHPAHWALQAVRGQVSWGTYGDDPVQNDSRLQVKDPMPAWPGFPVNGHGGLIPAIPGPQGLTWLMGASYERACDLPAVRQQDHDQNWARLQRLLPQAAGVLAGAFKAGAVHGWAGIRCTTPGRLPLLGCMARSTSGSEVWVCTGMGSRGLTFSALCAELMTAQLHGEPLPVERQLAQALMTGVPAQLHAH